MIALVAIEEKEIRDLIIFFLESLFEITVKATNLEEQALAFLAKEPDGFDLLVCDFQRFPKKLIAYIMVKNIGLHLLCLTEHAPSPSLFQQKKEWFHFLPHLHLIRGLERVIRSLFKEFQLEKHTTDQLKFCPVQGHLLLLANPLRGSIYVRLSETKYVRVMKEGFEFDATDLEYYVNKKKFDKLYVKQDVCLEIAVCIEENIIKQRRKKQTVISPEEQKALDEKAKRLALLKEKIRAIEEQKAEVIDLDSARAQPQDNLDEASKAKKAAIIQEKAKEILAKKQTKNITLPETELINELTHNKTKLEAVGKLLEKDLAAELDSIMAVSSKLGFTSQIQEITKKNVMQTIQSVRKNPRLSALLLQLRVNKEKYVSSHSTLLAYISCAVASQMQWTSDTTYQKLTLASFLHDSSMTNHDLAAIQSLDELREKESLFTQAELKAFRDHPIVSSENARQFSEIPPDVDVIIVQHHERPDGTGFPRRLTHSQISPLAAVFIVAHDMTSYLFKLDPAARFIQEFNLPDFLQTYGKHYQFGNFKKVLTVISKVKI